jgi:hypothetical protein
MRLFQSPRQQDFVGLPPYLQSFAVFPRKLLTWLKFKNAYRVPPKDTRWVLFEFVCEKSLSPKHLMTFCRQIRKILTAFLSGWNGSFQGGYSNIIFLRIEKINAKYKSIFIAERDTNKYNFLLNWDYFQTIKSYNISKKIYRN